MNFELRGRIEWITDITEEEEVARQALHAILCKTADEQMGQMAELIFHCRADGRCCFPFNDPLVS